MTLIYEPFDDGTPTLAREMRQRGLIKGQQVGSGRALRRAHERDQRRLAKALAKGTATKPPAIFAHPLFGTTAGGAK